MKVYVVWSEINRAFVAIAGRGGISFSDTLDGAFQYTKRADAERASSMVADSVILQWL